MGMQFEASLAETMNTAEGAETRTILIIFEYEEYRHRWELKNPKSRAHKVPVHKRGTAWHDNGLNGG